MQGASGINMFLFGLLCLSLVKYGCSYDVLKCDDMFWRDDIL